MPDYLDGTLTKIRSDNKDYADSIAVNISVATDYFESFKPDTYCNARVRSDGAVVIKPVSIEEIENGDGDE